MIKLRLNTDIPSVIEPWDIITELSQEELDKAEFTAKYYLKHGKYPNRKIYCS